MAAGVVISFVLPHVRADASGVSSQAAPRTFATGLANAVSIKATPSGQGFLVLGRDGTVLSYGDAPGLGNATLPHASVTLAVTHTGAGYWVFDANGCTATKGDATPFTETICSSPLNGPVLDAAPNPVGPGYWLVASDGGIFAFGGAPFKGSMGGVALNGPVVGMAPGPDGNGYWEVASDGGIFSFGEPFLGSMGAARLNQPVVGMVASGTGYMLVGADGGVFNFGNPFFGSLGSNPPAQPIVSIAPSFDGVGSPNGYWMLDAAGNVYAFGNAWTPSPGCPGFTYFDPKPGDRCALIGGTLTHGGWNVSAGPLVASINDAGRPQLCSDLTALNVGSQVNLMTGLSWSIETNPPGAASPTTAATIGGTINATGYIQPGGTAHGTICFADVGHPGQVLLVFFPAAYNRALWITSR